MSDVFQTERTYKIRTVLGAEIVAIPTVGKWYAGVCVGDEGEEGYGELGEYVGCGEFYDDDRETNMRPYDFLQEQK